MLNEREQKQKPQEKKKDGKCNKNNFHNLSTFQSKTKEPHTGMESKHKIKRS